MKFGVLGPVSAHDGTAALDIRGAKSRALLAALLLAPNRPVSLQQLQNALWGQEAPATAMASLHNHAVRLRRALGGEGGQRLHSVPNGYLLQVEPGESDLEEFTGLLESAARARREGDRAAVGVHAAAALALWRGEPLCDLADSGGLEADVHRLSEARLQAVDWFVEAELGQGRHVEAVPEIRRWIARYPLHEGLHVHLITALCRSGRQSDALEAFEGIRTRLADELGIGPGPALLAVHQQVLTADPVLFRQAAGIPARRGAGPSAGPAAGPAAPAHPPWSWSTGVEPTPRQLPLPAQDFTGRAAEVRAVVEALTAAAAGRGAPAVVAISGMGGVGKTALAVHATHQVGHLFPDGQLYADLRGFGPGRPRSAHDVLARFLTDLIGQNEQAGGGRPIPQDTDDRAALLRTVLAARRVLLVVDNARDADHLLPLLPGDGRSAVVVTSRTALAGLPGALLVSLAPLDMEEQRALLSALCGARRLHEDHDAALRVLAACAGLPLALRIVGARLASRPAWSLDTLARLVDSGTSRIRALSAGPLDVHRTFASSYAALRDSPLASDREAARLFRLLGLWPGFVFRTQSAAALIARPVAPTCELLELLVDSHLLESPEPMRYRLHDLLGEYSAERAAVEEPAQESEAARMRLLVWYIKALDGVGVAVGLAPHPHLALAEAPAAPLPVFADASAALRWCTEELPHVHEAIRTAAHCSRPDYSWQLAMGLAGYENSRWWTGQVLSLHREALRFAEEHGDRLGQAVMLRAIGTSLGRSYRGEEALAALLASLALFEELGDDGVLGSLLTNISTAYHQLGRAETALCYARRAMEAARAVDDPRPETLALCALGAALLEAGEFAEAEGCHREVLGRFRAYGDPTSTAITLANLGDTLRGLGRQEEALAALAESLAVRQSVGDVAGIADCLVITGRCHLHFARWSEAGECFERAVELAREHSIDVSVREGLAGLEKLRRLCAGQRFQDGRAAAAR
ncbi:BTAD domain-containing putative transcriptional regulator [Streptomyces sp. NPDC048623]|uniref:AfsR/SARP family transcriptional regulator n=1 Tax=Streptomyces sp. NPDC048623 TaxID=3155761 RepID=UPI003437882B